MVGILLILGELAERALGSNKPVVSPKTFCFLIRCSIVTRVNAIGVMHFRDAMADDWTGSALYFNGQAWRDETLAKLEYYESEYSRLKEMTSLLELAIWKMKIDNGSKDLCETMAGGNTKIKRDGPDFRLQCRISCGADVVIENVWQYLLPPDFVRSYVDDEEDNDEVDEEEDVDDDNDFIENIDDEEENEEH